MNTTDSETPKLTKPKRLLKLNAKQELLLLDIYKFRFVTSALLAEYKGLSNYSVVNKALKILVERGYLTKQYDSSYKLKGKAARYYLTTQGIRHIRKAQDNVEEKVLRSYYKNKTMTDEFVDHTIATFKVHNELSRTYQDKLRFVTRQRMARFDYVPRPLPDLFCSTTKKDEDKNVRYFVEIFDNNLSFLHKKRMKLLLEHYDEDEWQTETKTPYPILLLVLPDVRTEKRLNKHVTRTLEEETYLDEDDIQIFTTTMEALKNSTDDNKAIWTGVFENKKPQKLKLVNS
jgi:hypothetical protein